MGKLYDSLLSGTSGRTGRIVVANVYGNEITRTRPRKRNTQPTAKQLLIQNRMKRCAEFMQSYKGYACRHFGNRSGMRSCYNLAMTNLMENFKIDHATSSITPDHSALAFSRGNLLAAVPLSIKLSGAKLDIAWQDNSAGNVERENDLAQILLAAEDENLSFFIENAAIRSEAFYSANVPINFQGKILHVWMAFRSNDNVAVSNSQYIGTIA
ncbi:DUF6266 family protein [Epilithonimonas caeni]|uniref:DUF6266 family protein n=1 Tax=Epilithonimonas caeni TaxID=365343 RepID=UPI0004841DE9|nr:DUF6266 family protein [Epilithonimonas caeni]